MLSYFIALLALTTLCVVWLIFQNWLAKMDTDYNGYKAGCGGCTRSCNDKDENKSNNDCDSKKSGIDHTIDLSLLKKKVSGDKQ